MNSTTSVDKSDTDAYLVVEKLKDMESFEDEKIQSLFVQTGAKKEIQRYWDAKRQAEKKVLEAIEYAPDNQTEKYTLEKLPNLLQHLENRRIEFRIKQLLDKYIPVAEEREHFDILVQLFRFRINFIQRTKSYEERKVLLGSIYKKIRHVNELRSQLYQVFERRDSLRSILNSLPEDRKEVLKQFLNDFRAEVSRTKSNKYKLIELDIKRRIELANRDMKAFQKTINSILKFKNDFPFLSEEETYFKILLNASNLSISFSILQNNLANAKAEIEDLDQWTKNLRIHLRSFVEKAQLTNRMMVARKELNSEKIKSYSDASHLLFSDIDYPSFDKNYLNFALIACESNICIEDHKRVADWLEILGGTRPNPISPRFTLVANLWMIFLRIDQSNLDQLSSDLRRVSRYVKKWTPENQFARWVLKIGKQALKQPTPDYNLAIQQLEVFTPEEKTYLDVFPFAEWVHAKFRKKSLKSVIEEQK